MIAFLLFLVFAKVSEQHGMSILVLPALVCLIISLVQLRDSLRVGPTHGGGRGFSGSDSGSDSRYPYDSSRYAYDRDGNCYDIEDGSFTQGLDGRYRGGPDPGYVTFERDDHGELQVVDIWGK